MAFNINLFYLLVLSSCVSSTILTTNAVPMGDEKVVLLHSDNYDELTHSKAAVFVKFFAPWCAHSKNIKDDWQKLAEAYNEKTTASGDTTGRSEPEFTVGAILVAEVDCTDVAGGGKALCNRFNIESFPTLKYGDPTDLEDYNGKRSFEEIFAFTRDHLVPMLCSPTTLQFCPDDAAKVTMNKYTTMATDELESSILAAEKNLKAAGREFKSNVNRLTNEYKDTEETKRTAIKRIISGGDLDLMRQTIVMLKNERREGRLQKESEERKEKDEL